ncbi:hypothetical protein FRC07_012613 [Ceratobasidium sp. 392]|nr:hypothetical protein FRC07_012613 [Ceratobasidium sp. 392]
MDRAVSLLQVSTKFQFEKIHDKVIDILESIQLPAWKRYALAVDCLVAPWIVRSYTEICSAVHYHPAEIVAEFAQRNEMEKLSRLLTLREDYRTKLLLYAHGTEYYPYPKLNAPLSSILSGHPVAGLDSTAEAETPLLLDRVTRMIQPTLPSPVNICTSCRPMEKLIVSQVLGVEDLEKEVKKVMHLT